MDEPKSLDSLFKDQIYRIPDYQRGYAWQEGQLKDFWDDLINLTNNRSHYAGVLTLKQIPKNEIQIDSKEYWLVKGHSYHVHHIVDGQQRLTTFIIFIQAFVDIVIELPTNKGREKNEIYIADGLSVKDIESRYLFKTKPTGDQFRTYKFGYAKDNPSDDYLRYEILKEQGGGAIEETFYTLNLGIAYQFFRDQIRNLHAEFGIASLADIFEKLTQRFLFNEYVIKDEFDVFVAFETMNNRGKKLSDLELLKNRLIYLTTLYDDDELDAASRKSLRDDINNAWKEVYHQLGRNKRKPLNDDDFLSAHWIMYFKYSRVNSKDYIRFLLDDKFSPKRVQKKAVHAVALNAPKEARSSEDFEIVDEENVSISDDQVKDTQIRLKPTEIKDFVQSLKESAVHWFNSWYPEPDSTKGMSPSVCRWIDCLNRIGIAYFRVMVMSVLKNEPLEDERIKLFQKIERFIFIVFRMNATQASYGSSVFYNLARALDRKEKNINDISDAIKEQLKDAFNDDGTLIKDYFQNILANKFKNGTGYYSWSGLRYFLYEYETSLLEESRQKKVHWSDLLNSDKDKISIEHIYPQTETVEWAEHFKEIAPDRRGLYSGTLGNLLLLSMSINSSLQNDSFIDKKFVKLNTKGDKIRNGYSDGSHSEIEVSNNPNWGPIEIRDRGIRLLGFMEKRWGFNFRISEKEDLLFLPLLKRN